MVSIGPESLKEVKKEDDDTEQNQPQSHFKQRATANPESSIRRVGNVMLKYQPKYIIRNSPTTSSAALKRIFVGRGATDSKPESKEIDKITVPYDRTFCQSVLPAANHAANSETKGPVRFWRTPTGKLVKLDSKLPTTAVAFGSLTRPQHKFIRLANGKLARISTKKYPSSFARGDRIPTDPSSGQFSQFARDTGRLDIPSATATITSSSEPIDIATLIGSGTSSFDEAPLFEKHDSPVVKCEPMEVDEVRDQQKSRQQAQMEQTMNSVTPKMPPKQQTPIERSPLQQPQPSLATALKSIAVSSQVGDLGKIREQPLFSHDLVQPSPKESCNVCRVVIPGMKKNMLSLEARLGSLVETVQNLIVYLNPLDRKAAELASTEGASPLTSGISNADTVSSTSSTSRTYFIADPNQGTEDRVPSLLLPVARRSENRIEMKTVDADSVSQLSTQRPNVVRFIRQPQKPTAVTAAGSPSPSRPVPGKIRFVVADRATALRTVPSTSGVTPSRNPDKAESSDQKAEVCISPAEDVKPTICTSISSD